MDEKFDDGVEERGKTWNCGQVEPDHKIPKWRK